MFHSVPHSRMRSVERTRACALKSCVLVNIELLISLHKRSVSTNTSTDLTLCCHPEWCPRVLDKHLVLVEHCIQYSMEHNWWQLLRPVLSFWWLAVLHEVKWPWQVRHFRNKPQPMGTSTDTYQLWHINFVGVSILKLYGNAFLCFNHLSPVGIPKPEHIACM